jgi:two-component system sensor histidine kinase KdpD
MSGPEQAQMISVRRNVAGSTVAIALVAILAALMVPLREHLSTATPGIVFVLPVVIATIVGGLPAGAVAVIAGSLAYDLAFLPPYWTLTIGDAQYWVTIVVYVLVMVIVVRLVDALEKARGAAMVHENEARRLFELSELLVEERSLAELLETIVVTVKSVFDSRGVALLLPVDQRLEVAASSGDPFTESELAGLATSSGLPVDLGTTPAIATSRSEPRAVALSTPERPVGLLVLHDSPGIGHDPELLRTFANHLALALERAQLRQTALQLSALEEVDRVRQSLVGAVSHDLRTPLATIKFAVSSLLAPGTRISGEEQKELLGLVDAQADRLDRLVANLLDMTRIQAGALQPIYQPVGVDEIVEDAIGSLGVNGPSDLQTLLPDGVPLVNVDRMLVSQALANLLDNATRFAPEGTPVVIGANELDEAVRVTVDDSGPGIPAGDREGIFEMFSRRDAGGRAGLGLAIAKAFIEAHGGHIWLEDSSTGGARFVFDLPKAKVLVAAS